MIIKKRGGQTQLLLRLSPLCHVCTMCNVSHYGSKAGGESDKKTPLCGYIG